MQVFCGCCGNYYFTYIMACMGAIELKYPHTHKATKNNADAVSKHGGRCVHCYADVLEVTDTTDKGETVLCGDCGVDVVVPMIAVDWGLVTIDELHEDWFGVISVND